MKNFAIIFLSTCILLSGTKSFAEENKKEATSQFENYVLERGPISDNLQTRSTWKALLLGFGSGQYSQDRTYWQTGSFVLTGEILALAAWSLGLVGCSLGAALSGSGPCGSTYENMKLYGGLSFLGIRLVTGGFIIQNACIFFLVPSDSQ